MTNTTLTGIIVLMLASGAAGCNDSRPPTIPGVPPPSPPATTPPQPTPPAASVSGYVYDSAFRPVGGVKIEAVDGASAGVSTTTNGSGGFALSGTFDESVTFRASKDGYIAATATLKRNMSGGASLSFTLTVVAAPVAIAGDYTVTFVADSACAGNLPEGVRERIYPATISQSTYPGAPPQTQFNVTLTGAPFLPGHGSFYLGVAGDYVAIFFGDHGPLVVEQVAPNAYLALDGWTAVFVEGPAVSTISAPFEGSFEYCDLKSAMGSRYDCPSAQVISKARCESKNHRLVLTRR